MRTPKILAAAALLLPALALGNGYSVPNVSPRDLALAGSTIASQRDAGATFMTPAALSRLDGLNLSLAVSALDLEATWTGPGGSNSMLFRPAPPVGLFAAYGTTLKERRVGVGFGMTVPFGGNVHWPEGWGDGLGPFRVLEVTRRTYGFYLTGGIEVLPWLRLGGGPIYYRTTEYLKQATSYTPVSATPGEGELGAAGGAFSYDVAAEVDVPGLPLSFALDYKHKGKQTLEGRAHFTNVPPALEVNLADQDASHVLTIPNVLALGVAFRPVAPLNLTFAYTFDRYRVYEEDRFIGALGAEVIVPRHYRNGYTLRLGAEWQALKQLEVRAGLQRDVSGYESTTLSPSLPDASSWGFTAGAGWAFTPSLAVNAGLFLAVMDTVTASGPEAFPGSYDIHAVIASLGLVWQLDLPRKEHPSPPAVP